MIKKTSLCKKQHSRKTVDDMIMRFQTIFLNIKKVNLTLKCDFFLFVLSHRYNVTPTWLLVFLVQRHCLLSMSTSVSSHLTLPSFCLCCGCRNRDLSSLSQEFSKSVMPLIPFLTFTLQLFPSVASQNIYLSCSHSHSLGGSSLQPASRLPCHFPWFFFSKLILKCLPYFKRVSFLQNFQSLAYLSIFLVLRQVIFYHMYRKYLFHIFSKQVQCSSSIYRNLPCD